VPPASARTNNERTPVQKKSIGDDLLSHNVCQRVEILLVEDNPADVVLFKHLLKKITVPSALTVVNDGAVALDAVRRFMSVSEVSSVRAVFLDLNLPGKHGFEILEQIKSDPILAGLPVAVLTGSEFIEDHANSLSRGADIFLNKAIMLNDFFGLAKQIEIYLLSLMNQGRQPDPKPGTSTQSSSTQDVLSPEQILQF